ncbi:MAG: DUF1080 domain-containing protein [Bacteroidetes bacterium]|nr:MAG: DUF1080 domain-containing protein [Bacteroidota bacterium]
MRAIRLKQSQKTGSGIYFLISLILPFMLLLSCQPAGEKEEWISLFNGQDLDGWDIKIAGYELNENFGNTFRVEDGNLVVSYDQYEEFENRFGHTFYHQPFSHYKLRLEYRFFGEQVSGGAGWAYRNNGVMFHSQSAASMEFDQHFPVSVEAQLLGGPGEGERPTGAVCTPGTNVAVDGERRYEHCIQPFLSKTFHGDDWVKFELVVYGDSLVHHIVEGDTVFTYSNLRVEETGLPLGKGYIALQAESHSTAFRNIEILVMEQD